MRAISRSVFVLFLVMAVTSTGWAEIQEEIINYTHGDIELEGYLAYDDSIQGKRPGVIVVHDWLGFGAYGNGRAKMLAELGYTALAVDIYGKGVRPKDNKEAAIQAGIYKNDRALMRARTLSGYNVLRSHSSVDPKRMAVMGYCFGGTVSLELARSGADLAGVVSFHGGLDTLDPSDAENIKAKILVLHGADDPLVPAQEVAAFQKEMNDADVDWQMVYYSGAVHAFTKKAAGNDNSKGVAYNAKADRRSWEAMKQFFSEIF